MGKKNKDKEQSNAEATGEGADAAHDATRPTETSAMKGPPPWTSWSWML